MLALLWFLFFHCWIMNVLLFWHNVPSCGCGPPLACQCMTHWQLKLSIVILSFLFPILNPLSPAFLCCYGQQLHPASKAHNVKSSLLIPPHPHLALSIFAPYLCTIKYSSSVEKLAYLQISFLPWYLSFLAASLGATTPHYTCHCFLPFLLHQMV